MDLRQNPHMEEKLNALKSLLLRKLGVRGKVRYGPRFHVGPGSRIWAPRGLSIGRDVYIGKYCTVEVDGKIGDGTMIANAVGIVGRRDHDHTVVGTVIRESSWVGADPERLSDPIHIGSDVWIGYGAVVLSGVTIGDSAIIGAGAVVVSDIPANGIAVGSPARVVGWRFAAPDLPVHWAQLRDQGFRVSHNDAEEKSDQ